MKYLLYPIGDEIFKQKVSIRFEDVNEGFNRFDSIMIEDIITDISEERIIEFIYKAFELNGEDNSYVDFYLNRLDKESRDNLLVLLNNEDKEILKKLIREVKDETIYFRLTREVIPFITRLSTREVFFCTFYFTKYPCTIWGNYNMRFPVFLNDREDIGKYEVKLESQEN